MYGRSYARRQNETGIKDSGTLMSSPLQKKKKKNKDVLIISGKRMPRSHIHAHAQLPLRRGEI